jgi:hypothetical protein
MPRLRVRTFVPGRLEQVYEQVTGFPVGDQVDIGVMESQYGKLLEREDNTLTFLEDVGDGLKWRCVFDPPNQRTMRAVDSSWSDRIDRFDATNGGTLWTINWELKARGIKRYTQWLTFLLRDKRRIYQRVVYPVVTHFQKESPDN